MRRRSFPEPQFSRGGGHTDSWTGTQGLRDGDRAITLVASPMIKPPLRNWADLRATWKTLAAYERFEVIVAVLLRAVISVIIVVALFRLIAGVVDTILLKALDHAVFQQVFGSIMTLLIALEFNHTLRYVAPGARGIIQARIVILIALLALARKIIVADLFEIPPAALLGLAALALSLGVTYWLVRDKDEGRRGRKDESRPAP